MRDCTHVMIDMETLGNDIKNGMVMSLGAVAFKMDEHIDYPTDVELFSTTMPEYKKFYAVITLESQEPLEYEIDIETMKWWFHPYRNAEINELLNHTCAIPIQAAFMQFGKWIASRVDDKKLLRLWSHGSTYDCMHLAMKWQTVLPFESFNTVCPFRQVRDTRTIYELYESKFETSAYPTDLERKRKHHALEDAYFQARSVQIAFNGLMET